MMMIKKKANLFVRFSSAGIQMAILIIGGALGGQYLDENSGNEKVRGEGRRWEESQ